MNLSKITLTGQITSEVDSRVAGADQVEVSHFFVKTSGNASLRCTCWGNLSQSCKELEKNDFVMLSGLLFTSTFKPQGSNFQKKNYEVNVRELYKLSGEPKNISGATRSFSGGSNAGNAGGTGSLSEGEAEDISDIFDDSDESVPF